MRTITQQEWNKKPSDYKSIISGVHHILQLTDKGTILTPVKLKREMSSYAKAAKAIRKELKINFPNIKFSITSQGYSGGDHVRVSYRNGVPIEDIEKVISKYEYGHFNGMNDLYIYSNNRDDISQTKYLQIDREIDQSIRDAAKSKIAQAFVINPEIEQEWFDKFKCWSTTAVYRELRTLSL